MLEVLDELLSLDGAPLAEAGRRDLAAARDRVAEDRFNLVVLGEFKRGKSTLINALLDRDLLPTGVVPLTSIVTVIAAGVRDRLLVRFTDGREQERPLDELASYVTEARNPGNQRGVELARLELDHDLLRTGLELVDTPGVGSIHSHNTALARQFLPQVDAALCVLDAGQPVSEAERELFAEAARRVPRLLIVVNKIDLLAHGDREVALSFVRSALADQLDHARGELFALSARSYEGVVALLDRLRGFAGHEREALLLRSVGGLARAAAADIRQAARFESSAIALPLDELAERARTFEVRIQGLRAASAEAGDLLDRGIARVIDEAINEPLKVYARDEETRLRAALRDHVAALDSCSPRALAAELEAWVDETVQRDFERLVARFEEAVGGQLTELERRYARRVQEILLQVQAVAEDVFGARAADLLPESGLDAPSQFSFKLKDVEHALDLIVGFGRTAAPGAIGRRLVVRDAERRLLEMTDRHAGRLRSELVGRVAQAARGYRRDLDAAVEDAIAAIRVAIDRAADDRRRGERHAQVRLEQLAQIERRSQTLAARLDQWLGEAPAATPGNR